jgi:hypothetical protein
LRDLSSVAVLVLLRIGDLCGRCRRARRRNWGYKWEAKKESNRIRRENWRREIRAVAAEADSEAGAEESTGS